MVYLAIFHCYISFCKYGTTLKYLRGESSDVKLTSTSSKVTPVVYAPSDKNGNEMKNWQEEPIATESHLKKDYLY